MKLVDFFCATCRTRFEQMERGGRRLTPKHCGKRARRLVSAPALVGVKTQFRHALGREANNRELTKEVEAKGGHVPSMQEFKMVQEMTEGKVEPEYFGKPDTDAAMDRAYETAFSRYAREKSQGMHRDDAIDTAR